MIVVNCVETFINLFRVECKKFSRRCDVSEVFSRERAAAGDEPEGWVFIPRTRVKQRLSVDRTQPDQQTVVSGQSVDEVLQTSECKVRHFTQSGSAQQSPYHDVIAYLHIYASLLSSSSSVSK